MLPLIASVLLSLIYGGLTPIVWDVQSHKRFAEQILIILLAVISAFFLWIGIGSLGR